METKEHSKIQKLMKSKPAKAGVSVALVGTLALASRVPTPSRTSSTSPRA